MRGQVFELQRHSFFTFGGAYSIDRFTRRLNESYWEEELPSEDECEEAKRNLTLHNNKVDYIITHTAPWKIVSCNLKKNTTMPEMELAHFLNNIMYDIDFKHWYFGHWHEDRALDEEFTLLWFNTVEIA